MRDRFPPFYSISWTAAHAGSHAKSRSNFYAPVPRAEVLTLCIAQKKKKDMVDYVYWKGCTKILDFQLPLTNVNIGYSRE